MSAKATLGLALLGALALLATGLSTKLARHYGLVFEPGEARLATLSTETRARLATFDEELSLSYYVSARDTLPSHLAHLEEDVRSGLEALASGVAGPVRVEVLDPDARPELTSVLASAGVAPWRARRVERDGYREEELWSSLRLSYGARPAVVINGIGLDEARALQPLVLAHLEQLRRPRRPRVAISAPAGFDRLRSILASGAEVIELDFDAEPGALPDDVDLFFWLGGAQANAAQLARLDLLRERGGSALISIESLRIAEHWGTGEVRARISRDDTRAAGARALLRHCGLEAREGFLLDPRGAEVVGPAGEALIAPWHVRATPDNQDFRALYGQPNAALYFDAPTPFALDSAQLAELGFEATLLATASAGATLHELPTGDLTLKAAASLAGVPAPRAALIAQLASSDPWRGSRYIFADSSPFADAHFDAEHFGHGPLLGVLLETLTSDERMVRAQVAARRAAPLEELGTTQRLWLRLLVLGAAPLLLLSYFFMRGRRTISGSSAARRRYVYLLSRGLPALAAVVLVATLARGVDLDLSRDGKNRLTSSERATLEQYVATLGDELSIEFAFSADGRLPAEFRPLASEARRACEELSDELTGVRYQRLSPETAEQTELEARGLARLPLTSTADEVTTLRRVFASVVLSVGERREVLDFPGAASFDELRFRLAFAIARLASGTPTRVALLAEAPRLSPAEAALEFQQRGLFAPREAGVFGELEALLARNDFEVLRMSNAKSELPEDLDALIALQPRRDVTPTLHALSNYLARGGQALLAAQHFRVLARQLDRQDLELAFWPRPQFCDLNTHYLPELGLSLERELVFDTPAGSLAMQTRVDGEDGMSSYELQESTRSFFLRSEVDASVAPLFEGVGELLLPYASRWKLDDERLAARGLSAETWATTSAHAWSFDWKGGDLPRAVLDGEPSADDAVLGVPESALCVQLEGAFPASRLEQVDDQAVLVLEQSATQTPGRLLLLGNSEVFRDELLNLAGYAHDTFALRCVASLALEPELADFLRRERNAPALAPLDDAARRAWRFFVIAGVPLALLLIGLWRRRIA